jgi:hypothetical protein
MLDWRAASATTIVHITMVLIGTATLSWTEIICRFPVPDDSYAIAVPKRMVSFMLWDRVETSPPSLVEPVGPVFQPSPCVTDPETPVPQVPQVRYWPTVSDADLVTTGTSLICLTIDAEGIVVSTHLQRSSGNKKHDWRAISLARQARFAPGQPSEAGVIL